MKKKKMAMNNKRLQSLGMLAVAVMLVQIALSKWIYPLFGKGTEQLFSITPTTAVTSPTIGTKVLSILSGIIPINLGDFGGWIAIWIGALAVLLVGYWAYDQKWNPWKGKNVYQRLWAILGYGSVALWVALALVTAGTLPGITVPLLLGIAVNYAAVSIVVVMLAKQFKFLRV